ncbi:hypothetical protein ACR79M_17425 [Sphingobacterium spiritivorum]|uniref:hypothetical protein n=1 Tax=Sphingobacterium spiritivorum TaxID=258 RepID=UPI003DA31F95
MLYTTWNIIFFTVWSLNINSPRISFLTNTYKYTLSPQHYLYSSAYSNFASGNYVDAISNLNEISKKITSTDYYILLGLCYEKTGNLIQSEQALQNAVKLLPGRFKPKYYLMEFYLRHNIDATTICYDIIETPVKVVSKEIIYLKESANKYINLKKTKS